MNDGTRRAMSEEGQDHALARGHGLSRPLAAQLLKPVGVTAIEITTTTGPGRSVVRLTRYRKAGSLPSRMAGRTIILLEATPLGRDQRCPHLNPLHPPSPNRRTRRCRTSSTVS